MKTFLSSLPYFAKRINYKGDGLAPYLIPDEHRRQKGSRSPGIKYTF
jgi:hypothetical protein